jgi:hypothetical protein
MGTPIESDGGARRDRTADLLHAMQALSQLSYSPTRGPRSYASAMGCVKKKQLALSARCHGPAHTARAAPNPIERRRTRLTQGQRVRGEQLRNLVVPGQRSLNPQPTRLAHAHAQCLIIE